MGSARKASVMPRMGSLGPARRGRGEFVLKSVVSVKFLIPGSQLLCARIDFVCSGAYNSNNCSNCSILARVQDEAACQVNEMNSNAKDLEKIIDVLSSQKAKVEGGLKDMVKICMENLSSMNEFEDRVRQKVSDQAPKLVDLQQSVKDIGSNFQRLHHAYDDVSTRHLSLRGKVLYKDNAELEKHVQELEFQLKLAKQKLEVAEAESKCKEDSYVMAVETSKTEIMHLEEQIQLFSGRISLLEETSVQIKDSAASVVSKLDNQLDELESHSSQSITCLIHRLSACGGEFNVLQNMLHNYLAEQKELLKKTKIWLLD
ncbi:golgin subfamily B member 1 [Hordeum vulgare]|nr:golgin subfamily B member 1 [Hordeum vulgare]